VRHSRVLEEDSCLGKGWEYVSEAVLQLLWLLNEFKNGGMKRGKAQGTWLFFMGAL
jgi:hypothetical protein